MKKYVTIFLILLCGNAWGTITTLTQADIPFTKFNAINDTFYIGGNLICSTGSAIHLTGTSSNCLIDLGGDTLFYSAVDFSSVYGINIVKSSNTVIKNGTIYSLAADTSDWIFANMGISITGKDCIIRDMNIRVTGLLGSNVADNYNGSHDIYWGDAENFAELRNYVINCDLQNAVTYYWRRSVYPCSNIFVYNRFSPNAADSAFTTLHKRVTIDSCTLSPVNHGGVTMIGFADSLMGILKITNTDFLMSSQTVIDTFCTACDGGFKHGNTYAITVRRGQLLEAWGNTISTDTGLSDLGVELNGGNGIFLDQVRAINLPDGNYSLIHDNVITAQLGPLGGGHGTGIAARSIYKAKIYDNDITAIADTNESTPFRSIQANGIWTGFDSGPFNFIVDSVWIYHNKITTEAASLGANTAAIRHRELSPDWHIVDSANDLYSSGTFWTYYAEGGLEDLDKSYNDTLTKLALSVSDYTFLIEGNSVLTEATVTDLHSSTPDIDTAINFTGGANASFIELRRTINLTVNGNNSLPVSGATVFVVDSYNDTVLNTTTSELGLATITSTYWKEFRIDADSILFQPFTLTAISGSDTTTTSGFNLQGYSGQRDTTLVLSATEGSATTVIKKLQGIYIRKGKL